MKEHISTKEHLKDLGMKIKLYRVSLGYTQKQLEELSGVSTRSISRLEQGNSIQMDSFIKILDTLNLAGNLSLLVPDQTKRPSYYLKETAKQRYRASKKEQNQSIFKWGDEK